MEMKKWFKVQRGSAVKVVTRFNHSAIPGLFSKFSIHHLFLFTVICFTLLMAPVVWAEGGYQFVSKWGSFGAGDGQFSGDPSRGDSIPAHNAAIDSSGNIYVADTGNDRIQKFDSNGNFIKKWGGRGTDYGAFYQPYGIAVDFAGNVYVADNANNRVQKFDSNGKFITVWGFKGTNYGQFYSPRGIAVDSSGNVYVVDYGGEYGNTRIQKFNPDGVFLQQWGSLGSENGQFINPYYIAIDSLNNVYVTDSGNQRIQKFTSDGTFIKKWGSGGTDYGQFDFPLGIGIDSKNNIYITEFRNHRVQKFDYNGNFITVWGFLGANDGQFNSPRGIFIDKLFNVYVLDAGNNRIQKFTALKYGLTVTKYGTGLGTVTSNTGALSWQENSATENYDINTPVSLTAKPDKGYTFTGWSGACSGTGTCLLTMNGNKSVTATFDIPTYSIAGVVKDISSNQAIPSVSVTIKDSSNNIVATPSTDVSGNFTVQISAQGYYTIEAIASGYETVSPAQVVNISDTYPNVLVTVYLEHTIPWYSLQLTEGWNFISTPIQPADSSITSVLNNISQNVVIVWSFNNETKEWLYYKPFTGSSSLKNIESKKGYWIYMNTNKIFTIIGSDASNKVQLHDGWNFIGYNSKQDTNASTALTSINGGWKVIWNWTNGQWYVLHETLQAIPAVPALTNLKRGKAYWIKIKQNMAIEWAQ